MGSVVRARFDFDLHNDRQLAAHRGGTPAETLARFRATIPHRKAPLGPPAAWLGEAIVHAQDIRRPLGIERAPDLEAVTYVAEFFARQDFTVASKSAIAGLRLEATDGPFAVGDGPLVSGSTVALTMAMAGRVAFRADLSGPGVSTLVDRTTLST